MNTAKIDDLMELHYEARKLLQQAKESDFNRRECEIYLNYKTVKDDADYENTYLTSARLHTTRRDFYMKQYAEKLDAIIEIITKGELINAPQTEPEEVEESFQIH